MRQLFILFENASGYSLFRVKEEHVVGTDTAEFAKSLQSISTFGALVSLVSFSPFSSAANALENAEDIVNGICSADLEQFLRVNLLTANAKAGAVELGVGDKDLASSINHATSITTTRSEPVPELLRGIRQHQLKLIPELAASAAALHASELGLGHALSRHKLKFNVHREDNNIIQAIALLDQLDKDVNTNAMRLREWYSVLFPELAKLVPEAYEYAKIARAIGPKEALTDDRLGEIAELLNGDDERARAILEASKLSIGQKAADVDVDFVMRFCTQVIDLTDYRRAIASYLSSRMSEVAPNVSALIGDTVGARLISHAGSLTNLAKYPASTVQIVGAEKALFRALKNKGNTPKYGHIYHSSFIGRAGAKNKGRIARFLANKVSIASRIDSFADEPTGVFGQGLRQQVEDRLAFYDSGIAPKKNVDVMREAMEILGDAAVDTPAVGSKRGRDSDATPDAMDTDGDDSPKKSKKSKKDKKEKKEKKHRRKNKESRHRYRDDSDSDDGARSPSPRFVVDVSHGRPLIHEPTRPDGFVWYDPTASVWLRNPTDDVSTGRPGSNDDFSLGASASTRFPSDDDDSDDDAATPPPDLPFAVDADYDSRARKAKVMQEIKKTKGRRKRRK